MVEILTRPKQTFGTHRQEEVKTTDEFPYPIELFCVLLILRLSEFVNAQEVACLKIQVHQMRLDLQVDKITRALDHFVGESSWAFFFILGLGLIVYYFIHLFRSAHDWLDRHPTKHDLILYLACLF